MMNDCADGDMRDLLPGYVHGTLSSAERSVVAAHLATCEACAAEVELIRSASRAFPAPRVDVSKIVAALPVPPRRRTQSAFWARAQRIAAAIGIVAIGALSAGTLLDWGRKPDRPSQRPAPATSAGSTLVAVTPVSPVPPVVGSPAPEVRTPASVSRGHPAMSFGGGLSDLSDDELDTLLSELDGLDALPSVEPETHVTPILPPNDGGHGAR
jgi:hypothetical protein